MEQSREPSNNQPLVEGNVPSGSNSFNQVAAPRRTIYILLVGHFGCGKSELIDICSGPGQILSRRRVDYRLLNPLSFDYPQANLTEVDIYMDIARLLLHHASQNEHISGIIYCHSSRMALQSGTTQRSLLVLAELFLGRQEMNRLTVLVLQPSETDKRAEEVVGTILNDSTSFDEAVAGDAVVVAGDWTKHNMAKHLRRYRSMDPLRPPICHLTIDQSKSPQQIVENTLGSYGRQTIELYDQSLQKLAQDKKELEARIAHYQTAAEAEQRTVHANESRTLSEDEYERLRQAERDYASLRSQIQLQIGYEQGAIVQHLKEINDMIERLGDSISEHLVDVYEEQSFNKGTEGSTIADSRNLPGLQTWLHQYQVQMNLLPGLGEDLDERLNLSVEIFINFFIRSRLCNILSDKIFKPFHPFVEPTENVRLTDYYREIQKQEQQYTAGKWRSITFQMLCTSLQRTMEDHVAAMVQQLVDHLLEPIAKYLFGMGNIFLQEDHYKDIRQVINKAWEWTARTKTEVILLGDFHPTICFPGPFDSVSTTEFEPSSRKPQSRLTLCTLGFGLVSQKANGGGKLPNETIILKTSVLTDSYNFSI